MADSLLHQIALTLVPQVGAVTAKTLVNCFGDAQSVFSAKRKDLVGIIGVNTLAIENLLKSESMLVRAEAELHFMEKNGVQALFFTDDVYPSRLKQCADAPVLFYFKGSTLDLFKARRIVSIVGTRQPTEHGRIICEEIVEGLRAYNVLIVSGLAYGIDVTSHRTANQFNIPNIGVLGHGLSQIYPTQHRPIAQKMIENGGLISEFLSDAKPDREHFPMRNRIITGLCDALIVVETAASGGSMISAELAVQQEREIFAVPGRVNDPKSAGCNYLIKQNKARLMESVEDLAVAMQWKRSNDLSGVQTQLFVPLNETEQTLVDIIKENPEIPVDALTFKSNISSGVLAATILSLEFKGVVRTLPGKRYIVSG